MRALYLENEGVHKLIPGVFQEWEPFSSLEMLYLQDNQLQNLDRETFQGLNSLIQLTLSNNQLNNLVPGGFKGLDNCAISIS